jgi:aminopeptidase C
MKRSRTNTRYEFNENPVAEIGSMLSTTNSNRVTINKKNLKSTNQGRSGRFWMFSGLNKMFIYIK